jgi:hypothetical protein
MVAWVSLLVSCSTCVKDYDVDGIDMMTSKVSTLPYDNDKMQKMITLVEKAKGKSLCKNGLAVTDLLVRCKGWRRVPYGWGW